MKTDKTFTERAITAYHRKYGKNAAFPSSDNSEETHAGRHYVVLRNVRGILAVYRVQNNAALRQLKRWPKTLDDNDAFFSQIAKP